MRLRALPVPLIALALTMTSCSDGSSRSDPTYPALPANTSPSSCAPPTSGDLSTAAGWARRMQDRPDTIGLIVDDGRGAVVSHQPYRSLPLASAAKMIHLAAYARGVADKTIDESTPVPVADWERWYLPGSDGGAHPKALQRLGKTSRDTVTIDQIVTAMIQESDNSAADWLRHRLGDDALRVSAEAGGWADPDLPSFVGAVVRLARPQDVPDGADRPRIAEVEKQLGDRYASDPVFARAVTEQYLQLAQRDPATFLRNARTWALSTARATALDLYRMYRATATGALPGSDLMRRELTWQGPDATGTLGFKGGSYPGVLTFGSFLLRNGGGIGYGIVLADDVPAQPGIVTGQQSMALAAMTTRAGMDRVACAA